MGRAKILFSQCIIALTILVFVVDHRELAQQMMIDTSAGKKNNNADSQQQDEEESITTERRIRPPFLPDQVLEQYIQWHSESTLNIDDSQRQYALIYYYCPNRAGNILHSMFNSVVWAILHNRTMLWKYDTDFSEPNTVDDCQNILKRAEWLPSWDTWAPKLNLTKPIPIEMDPFRIHEYQNHTTVVFPMIPDQMSHHEQFFRVDWRDDPMHKRKHRQYIANMEDEAIQTAGRLYQYGIDYLLGMLFRELFTFQVHRSFQTKADDFTVALHSRHTVVGDDGSIITDETKCLETLLQNRTQSTQRCVVYLMSDRPATVQMLKEWLVDRNCTGVSTEDYSSMESSPLLFRDEHGPNPGIGFIRDLALVSQARSALVGDPGRSSYMLLQEIVEYDRRVDDWIVGRVSPETIPLCHLPGRYGKGYDYGPGTPHFIAFWRNQPLKPVQLLQQYKAQHSVDALRSDPDRSEGSYVIGYIPCCWMDDSVDDSLRGFLHAFLRAVATNQTLLWKYTGKSSDCHPPKIDIQSWLPSYTEWKDTYYTNEWTRNDDYFMNNTLFSGSHSMDKSEMTLLLQNARTSTFTTTNSDQLLLWLYEEGTDYLYGLLFHEILKLGTPVTTGSDSLSVSRDPHVTKVLWYDDGDYNSNQDLVSLFFKDTMPCLEPVVSNNAAGVCQIVLVTPRRHSKHVEIETILSNQYPHCSIIKLQDTGLRELLQLSHDPTWSALVGPRILSTTSSASSTYLLLRERLVYQRREVIWKLGRIPPSVPDLFLCDYSFE